MLQFRLMLHYCALVTFLLHCQRPGIVTHLKSASKDSNHEHDDRQIVSEHIPPWLQDSERWLLFRELPEFHHRNHDACYKEMENCPT